MGSSYSWKSSSPQFPLHTNPFLSLTFLPMGLCPDPYQGPESTEGDGSSASSGNMTLLFICAHQIICISPSQGYNSLLEELYSSALTGKLREVRVCQELSY